MFGSRKTRLRGDNDKVGTSDANLEYLKASIVDKISGAIMMVDRDFVITFVNEATRQLLKANTAAFRQIWPNFDPESIVGTCIDTFHKNPSHQRNLLSDPSKLPLRTEISVGDIKFSLLVNAAIDQHGKYVGNILEWMDVTSIRVNEGMLAAINKAQAVIEFTVDGKILHANENFLKTMGYTLDEIRGHHHSMFVDAEYRESPDYRRFWEKLARGEFDANQYKRIGKGGKEVWIQASYNPILDAKGKAFKVVKYATDVTAQVTAVQQTKDVVAAAKNNDLTGRIPLEGKTGDIAQLCEGVNSLLDTMVAVIGDIKTAVQEVTNASTEISTSTTDLSQRTEEQAASLEETSASMEQIAATVKKNAENAQQASKSANSTRDVADRGGQVVAEAVQAMDQIEGSSRKISDIIGVIDEIARQTNLLALNAAVEAARAGDAGRGFAVVASEVRSLAQRSSQAAKDIKDLITKSNSQVQQGVDLVNKAGVALTEIVESIKGVTVIVSDIAAASVEQASGIDQVNKALTQMDEVTQQNSALVEENAATAKTLEQQSKAMNDRVDVFIIGSGRAVDNAPRPAAMPRRAVETEQQPKLANTVRPTHAPAVRKVANGSARAMQAGLAAAVNGAPNWQEF